MTIGTPNLLRNVAVTRVDVSQPGPNGEDFAFALVVGDTAAEIIGSADYLRNAAVVLVDVNRAGPSGENYAYAAVVTGGGGRPDWVEADDIVVTDYTNKRYWRSDIGICSVTDVNYTDEDNWGPFDPETDIVAGVGFTRSSGQGGPILTQESYNLVTSGGGFSAIMDLNSTMSGTLLGGDLIIFGEVDYWNNPTYDPDAAFRIEATSSGLFNKIYSGNNSEDSAQGSLISLPLKVGASFNASGALSSCDGATTSSVLGDNSLANSIALWIAFAATGSPLVTATTAIPLVRYKAYKTQLQLNALTE